ncbi:ABC transporter permease (plasmid) [Peteryoungia desertarenae]|uniref:ABC transporter permease n=1 Tax=Peteryoungia desertarenae TaxID=1813451 RepID=A0ABX6QTJ4_9HYPH|nr:ABC transporter permease [Peteryoungia desertarenae]QLF71855.1 ABC transporter permease [Peteryoungia desertarenae]
MSDLIRATRAGPVHLVVLALTVLVFAIGVYSSDRFATPLNLANVQDQMVALAIVALAQTIVILSGGIDLSYAGALSAMCVVFAMLAGDDPASFSLAVVTVLALGVGIGLINGGITAHVGIHPLIVTLGTSTILAGAALLLTNQPTGSVPVFFEDFVYGRAGSVPYGMIFVMALYVLIGTMLWKTRFGTRIYAIGDNEHAASISGLPVRRTKVFVYVLSGVICAIAAIYMTGRFGVGDPRAGVGFDLRSITPVIVGGTLLAGGRGGVLGTFLAVILLAFLGNVLNFLNVSSAFQWIVEGLIIVAAVSFFARRTGK